MTPRDERELLMRRLAETAGKLSCRPEQPPGERIPAPLGEADRIALFGKTLAEAGGLLFRGPEESVLHDLGEALRAEGVTSLFFPEGDETARRVAEALVPFGPFLLATCADVLGGDPAVTAGFRTAEAGIAETGAVVETGAEGRTLLPGLLADVHVSLLPASSLYDRMDGALAVLCADPPRNITLCSGPCGPRKAIVLLL
jgi:hypothetical protein